MQLEQQQPISIPIKPLGKKQLGGKKSIGGPAPSGRMILNTNLGGGRIGMGEGRVGLSDFKQHSGD